MLSPTSTCYNPSVISPSVTLCSLHETLDDLVNTVTGWRLDLISRWGSETSSPLCCIWGWLQGFCIIECHIYRKESFLPLEIVQLYEIIQSLSCTAEVAEYRVH